MVMRESEEGVTSSSRIQENQRVVSLKQCWPQTIAHAPPAVCSSVTNRVHMYRRPSTVQSRLLLPHRQRPTASKQFLSRFGIKSKSHCDRQSVGQSVLVSGARLGPTTNFSSSLKFPLGSLRGCYFVAPSLTRWRVCNLLVQLLLSLARAVTLGSKSRRTHGHILLSYFRLPQPGGPGPRYSTSGHCVDSVCKPIFII
jgi:hypothetical protein